MIKADSETLHQFQECFPLLTEFSAAGSGLPSMQTRHCCALLQAGTSTTSSNAGSVCRIINNSGNSAMDFKTQPGFQAHIYIASQLSSAVYYFTITSLVSLNWQAEKDFEICFPESKKIEWRVQNRQRGKNPRRKILLTLENNLRIYGSLKSSGWI